MDLLEKFAAVDIRPTDCLTESDRQFCQRQQEIYQDAVESFYQITALWAGLCGRQEAALAPVVLHYQDAVKLILSWFDGRTFKEQAPHELVERCHQAAWREEDRQANFEQKKNLVKIFSGACGYGYYSGREQWHIQTDGKAVLNGLAHFETGIFDRYPDGIDDLLSEDEYLWYDLLEFEDCEMLEKLRLFKNGRMDIRFTNEGCAREFVFTYFGTVW